MGEQLTLPHAPTPDASSPHPLSPLDTIYHFYKSDVPLQRLVAVRHVANVAESMTSREIIDRLLPVLEERANDDEPVVRQVVCDQLVQLSVVLVRRNKVSPPPTPQSSSPASLTTPTENTDDSPSESNDDDDDNDPTPSRPGEHEGSNIDEKPPGYAAVITRVLPVFRDRLMDKAPDVRQKAGESIVSVSRILDLDDVAKHVLTQVLLMAHDDSEDCRVTAVPLMDELAPIIGVDVCRMFLVQDVIALSEDPSYHVRKSMAQHLGNICTTVGPHYTAERILPVFLKLARDSVWSVRKGCVESIVHVSDALDPPKRGEVLVPLFQSFAKDHSKWVRNGAFESLGRFIATLDSAIMVPDFLSLYTSIPDLPSSVVDSEVAFHCAFSFPAVLLTLGHDRWPELAELHRTLSKHSKFKVRKTLSFSLHEVAKIIGEDQSSDLVDIAHLFLKDLDEVRTGTASHLADFWRFCPGIHAPIFLAPCGNSIVSLTKTGAFVRCSLRSFPNFQLCSPSKILLNAFFQWPLISAKIALMQFEWPQCHQSAFLFAAFVPSLHKLQTNSMREFFPFQRRLRTKSVNFTSLFVKHCSKRLDWIRLQLFFAATP
eukprot:GABV01000052.1.p1 GENE.GABV01000052.1~~GABV01000052.1.p1  ORF type:complete len:600 (-),score=98.23 GABV01000052.1:530-2329(-)